MTPPIEPGQWIESDEDKETARIFRKALETVRKMTPDELFQSMVSTGIYTQDGRLRKEYGGDA